VHAVLPPPPFREGGVAALLQAVLARPAAPARPPAPSRPAQLLVLSASSPRALRETAGRLADHLAAHADVDLADVAWTLQMGRAPQAWRDSVVVHDVPGAIAALRSPPSQLVLAGGSPHRPVIFRFPDAGEPRLGQARALWETEPIFRDNIELCASTARSLVGADLRAVMWGKRPAPLATVAAPTRFALQYALARLWMSWGVRPSGFVGEGVGAAVAACFAGEITVARALAQVVSGEVLEARRAPAGLTMEVDRADSVEGALAEVGGFWRAGGPVEWRALHGRGRRRLPLPGSVREG
jgi:acyl transferase domain-containing protein